jgi:hypothetical protein
LLFGAVGLCCLPSSVPLSRRPRVALEVVVVAGWLGQVYNKVLYTFFYDVYLEMLAAQGAAFTLYLIGNFLFYISPLPFTALCWNNMNTPVLRLLARQTQCCWTGGGEDVGLLHHTLHLATR